MEIKINLLENSYNIITGDNILANVKDYFNFDNKKVLVVTDSNIPTSYSDVLVNLLNAKLMVIKAGEESKNIDNYLKIEEFLLENRFSRNDVVIALGGGVIGDLVAFASSTFKRGLNFINIPTSSLAMIDSSIGGKTAIDFKGVKNVIGTFYQPKLVLIDFSLLKSLPERQLNNGLVEALKAGYIKDPTILDLFDGDIKANLKDIITKAILVKKYYVENDEKEQNIRKILNYGHSYGHAFESYFNFSDMLYHGEAVGLGMYVLSNEKEKLKSYLDKLSIDVNKYSFDEEKIVNYILNDKKVSNDSIDLILVYTNGESIISKVKTSELINIYKGGLEYVRHLG